MKTFGEVLESADDLPVEDQETLIDLLRRRLAERRRTELVQAVKEARQEFKEGRCRPATPSDIMRRVLT
jgi:hypothetical protein